MTTVTESVIDLTLGMFDDEPNLHLIKCTPCTDEEVEIVLKADPTSLDGRSNWLWFRLPNGDLIFGCFPEGDTYLRIAK